MPVIEEIFSKDKADSVVKPGLNLSDRISETVLILPDQKESVVSFNVTQLPLPNAHSFYTMSFLEPQGKPEPILFRVLSNVTYR